MDRHRLSLLLEIALWICALIWLFYLAIDFGRTGHIRNLFEIALLGLLIWWPIVRTRIVYGYWMRDWDDDRRAEFTEQPGRLDRR